MGIFPKRTVPDALQDVLFGQSEPTDSEIEMAGGNVASIPMMRTYAILDAAKVPNLPNLLENSGLEHSCLFKDDAYDEMKDVAPWLVRLEEDTSFTRNLFTQSDAPWHLWGAEPGVYVRSRHDLDSLWRHFRKFTRIQDDNGKWFYWRFWDCWAMEFALKAENWLGREQLLHVDRMDVPWSLKIVVCYAQGKVTLARGGRAPARERLTLNRSMMSDWFCLKKISMISQAHKLPYDADTYKRYEGKYQKADEFDLEIMTLLHGFWGMKKSYHFNEDQSAIGQSRKKDYLEKLRFCKKQGVSNGV